MCLNYVIYYPAIDDVACFDLRGGSVTLPSGGIASLLIWSGVLTCLPNCHSPLVRGIPGFGNDPLMDTLVAQNHGQEVPSAFCMSLPEYSYIMSSSQNSSTADQAVVQRGDVFFLPKNESNAIREWEDPRLDACDAG